MGLAEAARSASFHVQRLAGSFQQMSDEGNGAAGRMVSITYQGEAVNRWGEAEQELLRATVRAVTRAVGAELAPYYVQGAIDFVHSAAWYVLMALAAQAFDPGKLPGNFGTVKGLTLPGYGLPSLDQELAALREQVAALPASYARAISGDYGPPGSRIITPSGSNGGLGAAWDHFIARFLHPNDPLAGGDVGLTGGGY